MNINTGDITSVKDIYKKDRHGFYIKTSLDLDERMLQFISNTLKDNEYVGCDPEIIIRENSKNHLFVYPEGTSFDMPRFIKIAGMTSNMFKQWDIKTLSEL